VNIREVNPETGSMQPPEAARLMRSRGDLSLGVSASIYAVSGWRTPAMTTILRPRWDEPLVRKALSVLMMLAMVPLLVSSDDDSPPTVEERATFCQDLENVVESLAEVREGAVAALLPANQAAFQDSLQRARANIDALESSARELEGGSDAVAELRLDVQQLRATLAQPDLLQVIPMLQFEIAGIEEDLRDIAQENQCPT
jgi:hypothetical protein